MPIAPSLHNIVSRIDGSDRYFLVNILTGSADIITPEEAEGLAANSIPDAGPWLAKGYLCDPDEEARLYRTRYADFLDRRDRDEIQIFFVPWYACNFACGYCYQESYSTPHALPSPELITSFFNYIGREFAGRKKYLTLFGGEPLLPGDAYRSTIALLLQGATASGLEIALVTNGYHLDNYLDLFEGHRIREIQVTLDGTKAVHDVRRPLKGGGGSFDRVVRGIDEALRRRLTINLRVVIDRENIHELPALARFAIDRGWTGYSNFTTQLGRNYELHTCQTDSAKLLSRLEMFREIHDLIGRHPEILEFHKPAFSISKFLFENGRLPAPVYDSCPGTKTEWAYDYTGHIYSCTATVGKSGESLGTFHPAVEKNIGAIEQWEQRDVTAIPQCRGCNLQLACGGGCGSISCNTTGNLHRPDCRPVKELIALGISTYFQKELHEL